MSRILIAVSLSVFTIWLAALLPNELLGRDRLWLLYISLPLLPGVLFLFPSFARGWLRLEWLGHPITFVFLLAVTAVALFFNLKSHPTLTSVEGIGLFSGALLLSVVELLRSRKSLSPLARMLRFSFFLLVTTLLFSSLLDLRPLEFSIAYAVQAPQVFMIGLLSTFFCLAILFFRTHDQTNALKRLLPTGLCLILILPLAFRHDSLSNPTSLYHWEYFVGPLRAWMSGLTPLWNIPTQYGLLSVFGAGLVPVESSWEKFYIFQSILLVASAMLLYFTLTFFQAKTSGFFFALAVPICFFFVDPRLIGPQPYPSSSAVRFFPFYLFWAVYAYNRKTKSQPMLLWSLGGLILFSYLWSFEGMAYVLAPLGVLAIALLWQSKNRFWDFFRLLSPWLLGLVSLSVIFLLLSGQLPRLGMLAEFASNYAAGFGGLPMQPWKTTFFLLFGFFSLSLALAFQKNRDRRMILTALAASWWILSSYYLGRATPENVLAMLPQFFLLLWIAESQAPRIFRPLFRAKALALFLIVAIPVFSGFAGTKLFGLKAMVSQFEFDPRDFRIDRHVMVADAELNTLVSQAGLKKSDSIIIYSSEVGPRSFSTAEGRWMPEKTWLPNPMQLLEAPISLSRRKELLARVFSEPNLKNQTQPSYIILNKKSHEPERWMAWLLDLRTYRSIQILRETPNWAIYEFRQ